MGDCARVPARAFGFLAPFLAALDPSLYVHAIEIHRPPDADAGQLPGVD